MANGKSTKANRDRFTVEVRAAMLEEDMSRVEDAVLEAKNRMEDNTKTLQHAISETKKELALELRGQEVHFDSKLDKAFDEITAIRKWAIGVIVSLMLLMVAVTLNTIERLGS